MHVVPQLIVSTLLLGGVYALIAVGLTLIFGVMRVVNFAHGEFLMLGMYLAFFAFTLQSLDPYFVLVVAIPLFFGVALVLWTGDFRVIRPWHSSVVLRIGGTAFNLSQVVAFAVAVALTVGLFA